MSRDYADQAIHDFIYSHDHVDMTTIGVDVGSSTFHLMFARVHLEREVHDHSSRFVVSDREVLWRSQIALTPYREKRIDVNAVREFVERSHEEAGITPADVDSGAVILTGEALRQRNARSLADAIAAGSGKFVCVSAGHHLESMLAAFGSGAVRYSEEQRVRLLHVDIGGGTTKLALIDGGRVVATAALMIGGRQLALDENGCILATSAGSRTIARSAGLSVQPGETLQAGEIRDFVNAQVKVLLDLMNQTRSNPLEPRLRLTRVLPRGFDPQVITFSGGVSEFVFRREASHYGDIGHELGEMLRVEIDSGALGRPVVDLGEGIRATVVGASQCTVQLSGSTVSVSSTAHLPRHNIPVVHPDLANRLKGQDFEAGEVASLVESAIDDYGLKVEDCLALAFTWDGDPSYHRLNELATGIFASVGVPSDQPLAVLIDQDIGASIGRMLERLFRGLRPIICLDGLGLSPLDFVDIGTVISPSGALPVVIKSLLFAGDRAIAHE